jgi:hypothetical protein
MIRYIALCGAPQAGKTETALILQRLWGLQLVDDKHTLREATKHLYGLTDWHVHTQEGKASLVQIGDSYKTVRTLLGELGEFIEAQDIDHFPRLALAQVQASGDPGPFCFPSVRQDQARLFRQTGESLVVEIARAGCKVVNSFDRYNPDLADLRIENNWTGPDSLAHLEEAVRAAIGPLL